MSSEDIRKCRVCGCDDEHACVDEHGDACSWVEDDLCSSCAAKEEDGLGDAGIDEETGSTDSGEETGDDGGDQEPEDAPVGAGNAAAEQRYDSLIDAIRDGMAANAGNKPLCLLGDLLTGWIMKNQRLAAGAKVGQKTLKGAMDAVRDEAKKHQTGNCGIVSDQDALKIALTYFGIRHESKAPADPLDLDALLGS